MLLNTVPSPFRCRTQTLCCMHCGVLKSPLAHTLQQSDRDRYVGLKSTDCNQQVSLVCFKMGLFQLSKKPHLWCFNRITAPEDPSLRIESSNRVFGSSLRIESSDRVLRIGKPNYQKPPNTPIRQSRRLGTQLPNTLTP